MVDSYEVLGERVAHHINASGFSLMPDAEQEERVDFIKGRHATVGAFENREVPEDLLEAAACARGYALNIEHFAEAATTQEFALASVMTAYALGRQTR